MSLLSFWGPVGLLSLLAVGFALLGLFRGARTRDVSDDTEAGDRREVRIYTQQLREIERDRARGVVSEDEAERLRTETARRLLDADKASRKPLGQSPKALRGVVVALALLMPLGAGALYVLLGASAYGDQPMAQRLEEAREIHESRPSQSQMEAEFAAQIDPASLPQPEPEYVELMEQLRAVLAERPDDTRGLRLLAVNEGNLGNYAASAGAWVRLVELQGANAPVEDLETLAEAMIRATGGRISPEAETILERILQRDPRNGLARYYLGLMFMQTERPDLTFRLWRGLLEDSAPSDPWVPNIRSAIEELAEIAGVRYTLPPLPAARGPSASDMEAAADMTPDERREMIQGMVNGLSARLANQGGTPQEWAQLISALGVLGERERARAIWTEAQTTFGTSPEALNLIAAAARQAGVIE